jgi:trehalose/maltose hydrolase-like predicted phosphorylase
MLERLWQLSEFPFQPEKLLYYETIFTIGNGYLGTRGSFEEGYEGDTPATLVHGIYDHAPGALVPELANVPNWLDIKLTIDGTPFRLVNQNNMNLNPPGGAVLGYRRTLHLDRGLLRREVLFRAESGSIVRLTFERFASLHDVHLLAQRVEITVVDGEPEIEIESAIEGDVTNNGARHWLVETPPFADNNLIGMELKTQQSGYVLGLAVCFVGHEVAMPPLTSSVTGLRPTISTHLKLNRESSLTFDKITAIYTSRDVENPLAEAQIRVRTAAQTGYDRLLADHEAEWNKYWFNSDIQIEGDEQAQFAIRFTFYHLLIAAPRHDDRVSIGAKTLSGFGYKGHVFWDTELFIVPPFILTQPQLARNLLMYRYHNLPGARHKAQANGYEGAMYPWESTDTGEETTPQWSDPQPDGTRIRIWTGDSEQHISTDIAYAINQYWQWTADDEFIRRYGAEIVLDTAVFWGSRVEHKNGRYEISQQIGPDEYHENVDNSVFTNRMVVWHLQTAFRLLEWLHANTPADAQRLTEALSLTEERLARWRDIIQHMFIPFDNQKQIHIQFPGFFDLEYIPVPHYEPRTMSVQAILGHHRTVQTQVIKQSDVVMLMALLGEAAGTSEVLLNNWNTYFPRTDHGSSLSPAIHAWVASRLGLDAVASKLFHHAAGIDLNDNKGNVRDGIHGAACGGLWQAIVFGFCGLRLDDDGDGLVLEPRLPAHWRKVTFHVYYRGERQEFSVENPVSVAPVA